MAYQIAPTATQRQFGNITGVYGSPVEAQAGRALQGAESAGLFDPLGSPRIKALMRQFALRQADARRRRGALLGQLAGLDPYQQRYAMVQNDIGANSDVSNILGQSELEGLTSNRDFLQRLFMGQLDRATQERLAKQQADAQQSGMFGQLLGGLGGAIIPGLFGAYDDSRRRGSYY